MASYRKVKEDSTKMTEVVKISVGEHRHTGYCFDPVGDICIESTQLPASNEKGILIVSHGDRLTEVKDESVNSEDEISDKTADNETDEDSDEDTVEHPVEYDCNLWIAQNEAQNFGDKVKKEDSMSISTHWSPAWSNSSTHHSNEAPSTTSICTLAACTATCLYHIKSLSAKITHLESTIQHLKIELDDRGVKVQLAADQTEAEIQHRRDLDTANDFLRLQGAELQKKSQYNEAALTRALARENQLKDTNMQLHVQLSDKADRFHDLELHIIDMGRRKFAMKKKNRELRLAAKRLAKESELASAVARGMSTIVRAQGQEIQEYRKEIKEMQQALALHNKANKLIQAR